MEWHRTANKTWSVFLIYLAVKFPNRNDDHTADLTVKMISAERVKSHGETNFECWFVLRVEMENLC